MKIQKKKITFTCLIAVVALACLYSLWCYMLKDDVIWENVEINGISMQGKTKSEAQDALLEQFEEEYKKAAITIQIPNTDARYEAEIYPVLGMETQKTIEDIYGLGHGSWFTRGVDRIRLMNQGTEKKQMDLKPKPSDLEALDAVLKDSGIENLNTMVESSCRITDTSLIIKKGVTGIRPDMKKLKQKIVFAIKNHEYDVVVECPVVTVSPSALNLQVYYDDIFQEASDAYIDEKNDNQVVPAQYGISFDVSKAQKRFDNAEEGTVLTIPFVITEPEVTTESLTSVYAGNDVLGSYTTHGGGTDNRITNLTLAAEACDGIVLQPGEVFSYNDMLGERTEERGYKSAGIFVNGQHSEGIGGGICQVSTTLFVASLYANLEIVERYNHSGRVDYVPEGMDSAVSWGGQDFKFRNSTDYPIRISAKYEDGTVNVKIYGTRVSANTVKITTEQLDEQSYKTWRTIYDAQGNELSKEEICTSHYMS